MSSANDRQVGGTHYGCNTANGGEQHWDRIWRLYGRGYFIGCATKYLERYHLKNGVQDLEKARHFIEKLIELETEEDRRNAIRGQGIEDTFDKQFQAEIGASRRATGA